MVSKGWVAWMDAVEEEAGDGVQVGEIRTAMGLPTSRIGKLVKH